MPLPLALLGFWSGVKKFATANPKLVLIGLGLVLFVLQDMYVYHRGSANALQKVEARSLEAYAKEQEASRKLREAREAKIAAREELNRKNQDETNSTVEGIQKSVEANPSPSNCVVPDDEFRMLNDLVSKTKPRAD